MRPLLLHGRAPPVTGADHATFRDRAISRRSLSALVETQRLAAEVGHGTIASTCWSRRGCGLHLERHRPMHVSDGYQQRLAVTI